MTRPWEKTSEVHGNEHDDETPIQKQTHIDKITFWDKQIKFVNAEVEREREGHPRRLICLSSRMKCFSEQMQQNE